MKKEVFSWLKLNIGKSFAAVCILSLLGMCASIFELSFVVASKNLINVATDVTEGSVYDACVVLVVLLLSCLIINGVITYIDARITHSLERKIKSRLFSRIMKKDYLSFTKCHSADVLNRIDSDVNVVVSAVVSVLPAAVIFATLIIGALVLLYDIIPQLAYIIIVFCPVVAILARLYSVKYKKLHKNVQVKDSRAKSYLLEAMQSMLVIKAFSKERVVSERGYVFFDNVYKAKMKRAYAALIANIGVFLIFNAGYYMSFAYGVYMLNLSLINFGELMAILQLVDNVQQPMKSVSSLIPQFFAMIASVERIMELENIKSDTKCESDNPDIHEIIFDNVGFEYDADNKITNMNFTISKGDFVAITGESGSGKSTCLKLLMGIINPTEGSIRIKTDKGVYDADNMGKKSFSYVAQGNLLFSGSIRDNVTFFEENPDDEKVINALKTADIWDYIHKLEDGIDTCIGENGEGLSEGQAQRIAIARAIYADSDVIILDEATSSLDDNTEKTVLDNISRLDKTVVAVTHRKYICDICNKNIII